MKYSTKINPIKSKSIKSNPLKVNICGIQVDKYSFDEVVEQIINHALSKHPPEYVVTPNAQHIVTLQKDNLFREIYQNAFLTVPDGVPLLWASRLFNTPLSERVSGIDLFEQLCQNSAENGLKIFLLGGRPGAAEKAADTLKKKHPNIKIVGTYCPPYGFESDQLELDKINSAILSAKPDILFVGLGAPKQEYWMYKNYQNLNVPVSLGIGVSFELVSGMVQRAPKFMQEIGLEWFFRLIVEPRRLWKRYVIGNTIFILLVLKQKIISRDRTS
jgi:N-acetylglucosaminyldiphosphoundecaprenol N-acetyl-beta-D-mannosaminyltransferase